MSLSGRGYDIVSYNVNQKHDKTIYVKSDVGDAEVRPTILSHCAIKIVNV